MDYAQSRFVLGTTGCELNGLIFAKIRDERVLQKDFDSAFTKKVLPLHCVSIPSSRLRPAEAESFCLYGCFRKLFSSFQPPNKFGIQHSKSDRIGNRRFFSDRTYSARHVPCERRSL